MGHTLTHTHKDSPSTAASVLLLSLSTEPSSTHCTRRIPACSPPLTGLRDHSSSGRGYLQQWLRADPTQWWAEGREYWAGRPHQLLDRRPCSRKNVTPSTLKLGERWPSLKNRNPHSHDLRAEERRENKQTWVCWWRAAPCATSWLRSAGRFKGDASLFNVWSRVDTWSSSLNRFYK